jgi:hypothetical protein
MLMFYDIRAQKYLESSINSNRTVMLKASKGYVVSNSLLTLFFRTYMSNIMFYEIIDE